MIEIWKATFYNHYQHKREADKSGIPSYRIKIKSEELHEKLRLSYDALKKCLDALKKLKLITGFVYNEPQRAGWTCTSKGALLSSYLENRINLKNNSNKKAIKIA